MRRLLLLRHAKSSRSDPSLTDADRPLNDRGVANARQMGQHIADNNLLPDMILCSSARRTRETLAGMLPFFNCEITIHLLDCIYEGDEKEYLDAIKVRGYNAKNLLIIGHCPTIQNVALDMLDNSKPDLREKIASHFPTSGLAVIAFKSGNWKGQKYNSGSASAFYLPKEL